jgi:hypothetical protein
MAVSSWRLNTIMISIIALKNVAQGNHDRLWEVLGIRVTWSLLNKLIGSWMTWNNWKTFEGYKTL